MPFVGPNAWNVAKSPEHRAKLAEARRKYFERTPQARKALGERKKREAIERLACLDTEAITHKKCTKCGEVKPLADFSIRRDKLKCGLIYVRPESSCRGCCAKRNKQNVEKRKAERRDNALERHRRWKEKLTDRQKAELRRRERERQAIKRRKAGIPPRNFKKRSREPRATVPVEPMSVLIEVLLESHTKEEISLRSGVDQRQLRRIEAQELSSVNIEHVDAVLLAFGRQDDLNELYSVADPPERLTGYHVLDPKGILDAPP